MISDSRMREILVGSYGKGAISIQAVADRFLNHPEIKSLFEPAPWIEFETKVVNESPAPVAEYDIVEYETGSSSGGTIKIFRNI